MLVVFAGPSLSHADIATRLPRARLAPPACRGDVDRAVAQGASSILLIDGGFGQRFAVAPSEIVRALRAGVAVAGAASLGAIRAAECHPAGMEAIGAVAGLYRLRVLRDDDEVAVATEPDRGFRATSVALVNIRFAVLRALRAKLVERAGARAMLTQARRAHFSERRWAPIIAAAGARDVSALTSLCLNSDIKRRDAERAIDVLARRPPRARRQWPAAVEPAPDVPAQVFGAAPERVREELLAWLRGSGRYRQYWDEAPSDPASAWAHLAGRRELDHELMRWFAVTCGAREAGGRARRGEALSGRATVARGHGYDGWDALAAAGREGRLPGGVSLREAERAARCLAAARRGLRPLG